MQRNFVASGAASAIVSIAEKGGVPLEPVQRDLTPLQRMVITKELERRQEEIEREQNQAQQGSPAASGIQNSHPKANKMEGDTITYVNENA